MRYIVIRKTLIDFFVKILCIKLVLLYIVKFGYFEYRYLEYYGYDEVIFKF